MVKLGETVGNAKNQWLLLDKREKKINPKLVSTGQNTKWLVE